MAEWAEITECGDLCASVVRLELKLAMISFYMYIDLLHGIGDGIVRNYIYWKELYC
jgi:hypothetical protein